MADYNQYLTLVQVPEIWDSEKVYLWSEILIGGVFPMVSHPQVIYLDAVYVTNGSAQPTLGTAPDEDTAWTKIAITAAP